MTGVNSKSIPETEQILQNWLFATEEKIEKFFRDLNEELQSICSDNADETSPNYTIQNAKRTVLNQYFEKAVPGKDWIAKLPDCMCGVLDEWETSYKPGNFVHLIRFVRNFHSHFDKLCKKQEQNAPGYKSRIEETIGYIKRPGNIIDRPKNYFIPFIMKTFPNLIPVLEIIRDEVLFTRGVPSFKPDGQFKFNDIIVNLCKRAIYLDKGKGKQLAAFQDDSRTNQKDNKNYLIEFMKLSKFGLADKTVMVSVTDYQATICIESLDQKSNIVKSQVAYPMKYQKDRKLLIILTDSFENAAKRFKNSNYPHTVVYLGNFNDDLKDFRNKIERQFGYKYIPTRWEYLDKELRINLKNSHYANGKGKQLSLRMIKDDSIFNTLEGELLLNIINKKWPDILTSRGQMKAVKHKINFGIPDEAYKNSVVLYGSPFTGKDTFLSEQVSVQDKLVLTLDAKELSQQIFKGASTREKFPETLATFFTDEKIPFAKQLVLSYLTSSEKEVIVSINNFEDLLDPTSCSEDGTENQNYQEWLTALPSLNEIPGVRLMITARPHCKEDLSQQIENVQELPFLNHDQIRELIEKYSGETNRPFYLSNGDNNLLFKFTPLLCRIIGKMIKEGKLTNSDNPHQCRVEICHEFVKTVFLERLNRIGMTPSGYTEHFYKKWWITHIIISFHRRYPAENISFLRLPKSCESLTVAYLDIGFLKFQNTTMSKDYPIEQQVYFEDQTMLNYFLAYGVFYLSRNSNKKFRSLWEPLLKNFVCKENDAGQTEIINNIRILKESTNILSDKEKLSFNEIDDQSKHELTHSST